MENRIVIYKETKDTWTLEIATAIGTEQEYVTKRIYKRLVDAMQAAYVLRLHVDNEQYLPIRQYQKIS